MINGESGPRQEGGGEEKMDFQKMNFEQLEGALREARELAARTFKQYGDEFRNAEGHGMFVGEKRGVYRICGINHSLRKVHEFVAGYRDPMLAQGSSNREEVIRATREMLEKLGYRIIE